MRLFQRKPNLAKVLAPYTVVKPAKPADPVTGTEIAINFGDSLMAGC